MDYDCEYPKPAIAIASHYILHDIACCVCAQTASFPYLHSTATGMHESNYYSPRACEAISSQSGSVAQQKQFKSKALRVLEAVWLTVRSVRQGQGVAHTQLQKSRNQTNTQWGPNSTEQIHIKLKPDREGERERERKTCNCNLYLTERGGERARQTQTEREREG